MRLTKQTFTQPPHPCNTTQRLALEVAIEDAHAHGEYLTLTTYEWALYTQADVDALYHLLTGMLAGCGASVIPEESSADGGGVVPHAGNAS